MNLLIVDESSAVRDRLAKLLAGVSNLELMQAASVAKGIESMRDVAPDVIVVDILLPDGSGIGILKRAKQLFSSVTVFVNSNYTDYRSYSLAAGADAFFDKSFDFDALIQALQQMSARFSMTPGRLVAGPLGATESAAVAMLERTDTHHD